MLQRTMYDYGEAWLEDDGAIRFSVGTPTFPDLWAYVDLRDWPMVAQRRWRAAKRKNGFYAVSKHKGVAVYLHRAIMSPPDDMEVDHSDGNALNNRRRNLEVCTHARNMELGGDRRRGGPKPPPKPRKKARPHIVTRTLSDGTQRQYVYPPRSKRNETVGKL